MAMDRVSGLEALSKVLEEGNSDFLRRVLLMGLQAVMESDVAGLCQAGPGERTPSRTNHRNGFRERDLETRMGTLSLAIPKLRRGSYLPDFLEPRRRWEQAFVNVAAEAYVVGRLRPWWRHWAVEGCRSPRFPDWPRNWTPRLRRSGTDLWMGHSVTYGWMLSTRRFVRAGAWWGLR